MPSKQGLIAGQRLYGSVPRACQVVRTAYHSQDAEAPRSYCHVAVIHSHSAVGGISYLSRNVAVDAAAS